MKKKLIHILFLVIVLVTVTFYHSLAQGNADKTEAKVDTTGNLEYPFDDEGEFQYPDEIDTDPLYLNLPSNIRREFVYDPLTKEYIIYEKIGDMYYRLPKAINLKDYIKYDFEKSIKDYWETRKETEDIEIKRDGIIPELHIESQAFNNIFGSDVIDINVQGYVEVQFGVQSSYVDNPAITENSRRSTTFDFDDQINISVNGTIGDKLDLDFNYNTESTFDFENQMNIQYQGKEDEILQNLEAGNVSLPLNGTLIQGGTNLFGIKSDMKFGKLTLSTVVSQSKGETETIETDGGVETEDFEVDASDYDANRHYFLSKYFRDHYEEALSSLPTIRSRIEITKIEVWVTNTSQDYTSARDIVAFVDLGETDDNISNEAVVGNGNSYPANDANNLYDQLTSTYSNARDIAKTTKILKSAESFENGVDWEKLEMARKLSSSEYTLNEELGYISLTSALNNDEVLAVAFQYTVGASTYQVGEFTSNAVDSDKALYVKLLKATSSSPELPTWDLMMKNVYNIGGYDISEDDFDLQIVYEYDSTNSQITYLPGADIKDSSLLRFMNLDNLDDNLDYSKNGNGVFDFVEGVTIIADEGRVFFPILEPFGSYIEENISNPTYQEKYAFTNLYTKSKSVAQKDTEHDKYLLVGSFEGSSSSGVISLNSYNLTSGSVTVTANGTVLEENVDYVVDYSLGQVKIINQSLLDSGASISVTTDSEELVSVTRKTLIGTHANYEVSDHLNIGGTVMFLNERPVTNKVDIGEEPVNNLMLGLDMQYDNKINGLTDLLNLLPFYESDVESSISAEGEVAKLITLNSNATDNQVYIDDFDGVETDYSYITASNWHLASIPQKQESLFPEADYSDSLISGYNRAKLAWYHVDYSTFYNTSGSTMPSYIKADADLRSNHYTRRVTVKEIYPNKDIAYGSSNYQTVLDLAYYPKEKGPYNFDSKPVSGISEGVNSKGELNEPDTRWAGITHEVTTTNFESANVEYIDFWLLDPFIYDEGTNTGGDLYFDLGNVSEDALMDSRKSYENGLPDTEEVEDVDTTAWGRVSSETQLTDDFDNTDDSREYQDIGLDGLNDEDEASFFKSYLESIKDIVTSTVYSNIEEDPANDNYHYFRGSDYDDEKKTILERYKLYNNPDGNSPTTDMVDESYSTAATTDPDNEDINDDYTLSESEAYFQYKVSIRPEDLVVGQNYVVAKEARSVTLDNNETETVNWYHFKIPIRNEDNYETFGSISDFESIRFMRMFLRNFSDSVILRFATLALARSDWEEVEESLVEDGSTESADASFEFSSIGIEEDGSREPINYILPPGVSQEEDPSTTTTTLLDEESMLLKVTDLESGDAKAVYKESDVDLRLYEKLKMWIHAEAIEGYDLDDNELSVFISLGTDRDNYYEYEIPLALTPEPTTSYSSNSTTDRYTVWPEDNELNIELSKFTDLKTERDEAVNAAGSTITDDDIYEEYDDDSPDGKDIISIKGSPTLGDVKYVYIGIRNPQRNKLDKKSIEVWVNELRVSGYENTGGWASTGNATLKLADLATITASGSTESVGWGSIDQTATERNLESSKQFNFSIQSNIGKLLPKKIGLNMPLYYYYSNETVTPEYDPLDTDIKLSDALDAIEDPDEREEYLNKCLEVETTKSITFDNVSFSPVRKNTKRTSLPFDIENFTFSFSKTDELYHDIDIESHIEKSMEGEVYYNYSLSPKSITPFKKIPFLKNKAFSLIRDLNFNLIPQQIAFRLNFDREYESKAYRDNTSSSSSSLSTTVDKSLTWDHYFDITYKPFNSMTLTLSTENESLIDELDGVMDKDLYPELYKEQMAEIWKNIKNLGRVTDYDHTFTMNYRVPINKFPLLDWTSASVNYTGTYDWEAGSETSDEDSVELGNTIYNTMNLRASGQLNFQTLYNKVPYLKNINQRFQSNKRSYGSKNRQAQNEKDKKEKEENNPKKVKDVEYTEKKVSFRADVPKSIFHRLGTKDVKVVVLNERKDTVKGEVTVVDENRINFKPEVSVRGGTVKITGKKEIDELFIEKALAFSTRMLMGVRSATVSYIQTGSTELPGFLPDPYLFGARNDKTTNNLLAPTIPFLLGWQDENFGYQAAKNGWITTDTSTTKEYYLKNSKTWSFNVTVEPIPNIKITLSGTRKKASNNSSYINFNDESNEFEFLNPSEDGSFSMSIFTLKTLFKDKIRKDDDVSVVFDKFKNDYRTIIKDRLNKQRGWVEGVGYTKNSEETIDGVSLTSPDVIIPAFLAAYTKTDPKKISLSPFPGLSWIRPSWKITYTGNPQKISWMKDYVQSLNFSHSYKSTYNISSFETNLDYDPDENGLSWVRDETDDTTFISKYDISSFTIQESMNPLISMDVTLKNSFDFSFSYARTRNLNFSFSSIQLNETIKNSYTLGLGYRITGFDFLLKNKQKSETVSNDLNLTLDVTGSNYKTYIREIDDDSGELSAGTKALSFDFEAEYTLSDKLTVTLYYQLDLTKPWTTSSYNTSNTDFGFTFNFSLM